MSDGEKPEFTEAELEKGRQVAEYYENLPADAPSSPLEPIFKELIMPKDEEK